MYVMHELVDRHDQLNCGEGHVWLGLAALAVGRAVDLETGCDRRTNAFVINEGRHPAIHPPR